MDPLIESLLRALDAHPADVTLRVHVAELLVGAGRRQEAIAQIAQVLAADPTNAPASELMARALSGQPPADPAAGGPGTPERTTSTPTPAAPHGGEQPPSPQPPPAREPNTLPSEFDWHAAERQIGDLAEPMFVNDTDADPSVAAWDVERTDITLADVGGLVEVKQRLEASFLAPLRHPELRAMYGKSLRGGLLLYGPPGCGKTFVARAVAGEMGAKFIAVGLADILDMYVGNSEKNLHELFQLARHQAPVVLFLDELDALGIKRSQTRMSGTRGTVNQLLSELDGVDTVNEGVFVLAATNQPWDIDPALRRPGRLDRTLLVLPPDQPAREAIFRHHLARRPVAGIDIGKLAKATEGFSGADIAHICDTAAEHALMDSARSGTPRMIAMDDLARAIREVRPSTGAWFDMARNVVTFADTDGTYTDLRAYMKRTKRL